MAPWNDPHVLTLRKALHAIKDVIADDREREEDARWEADGLVRCPRCDGSGVDPSAGKFRGGKRLPADYSCQECDGQGAVPREDGQRFCCFCSGTGITGRADDYGPHATCEACGGRGEA